MAFGVKDIPTSGGWFKPDEHTEDVAILIEVTGIERQRPTDYGPKDSVITTSTFFATQAELDEGTPTDVVKGLRYEQTYLARDLMPLDGEATIVVLGQSAPKKAGQKPAWVWRQPSNDVKSKVIAYGEAREAAKAEAIASAPSFD